MAHTKGVANAVIRVLKIHAGSAFSCGLTAAEIADTARAMGCGELSAYQVTKAMQRVRALGHNVETTVTKRQGERAAPATYRLVDGAAETNGPPRVEPRPQAVSRVWGATAERPRGR